MVEFSNTADLDVLRYGSVWEDHRLAEDALEIRPGDNVLCVASAGCNALNLLLQDPASVVAVDVSVAQLALVELKLAALRIFDYDDLVAVLGYREHSDRLGLYERLRSSLSQRALSYWDTRPGAIADGPVKMGRLDSYFRIFQETVISPLVGMDEVARFLAINDLNEQQQAFIRLFARPDFEAAFRAYYGKESMIKLGRDASQLAFVDDELDIGDYLWDRFEWVCSSVPACENPYLELFLTGRYRDPSRSVPWLDRENVKKIRPMLRRVSLQQAEIGQFLAGSPAAAFSKAVMSNVFEYMSDESTERIFKELATRLRAGGRFCYWNFLVPRSCPAGLSDRITSCPDRSKQLWSRDRSWLYRAFHVNVLSE